jgi:pimeloyl-ACP methyl ester carboxylesterase
MIAPVRAALIAAALALPGLAHAQSTAPSATGDWYGTLNAGAKVPLVAHIRADGTASLDSPTQGAKDLPLAATLNGKAVTLVLTRPPASFVGQLSDDGKTLAGQWIQGGTGLPLTLHRDAPAAQAAPNRPQTPKPPFPYRAEEVAYVNPASGLKLAGTLTLPPGPGPFPVALLITGSGTQDRDETVFDHKPYLLLADRLTREGVAVLRVDDRGAGGSEAGPATVTSADFATDVAAGVAFLRGRKDIDPARVGLIGHSEGGLIAPLVAAKDPKIAFLVLLSAPGVDGRTLMLSQNRAMAVASGATPEQVETMLKAKAAWFDAIRDAPDDAVARARLTAVIDQQGVPADSPSRPQILSLASPWWRYSLNIHPEVALRQVKVPVLAIGGSKDLQAPAAENLAAIKAALAADKNVTVREIPDLNHLLQTARTGLPSEYPEIEETTAPAALNLIVDWTVKITTLP